MTGRYLSSYVCHPDEGGIFRYHLEDASFLGMTGGIVSMTKKICHPEPGRLMNFIHFG